MDARRRVISEALVPIEATGDWPSRIETRASCKYPHSYLYAFLYLSYLGRALLLQILPPLGRVLALVPILPHLLVLPLPWAGQASARPSRAASGTPPWAAS